MALRHGLAPRWTGWLGIAVALCSLASTGTLAVRELFPVVGLQMLLFPVWILALVTSLLGKVPPVRPAALQGAPG